jgi:AraC-like DNA-binding protein
MYSNEQACNTLVTPPLTSADMLLFGQLAESPEFREFALILKRLTGLQMALHTADESHYCIGVDGDPGNPLCTLIRSTTEGRRRCQACDLRYSIQAALDGEAHLYMCHAGFYDMVIPIRIHGVHMATLSTGQVLTARPSEARFVRWYRRLSWLDIPEQRLRKAYARVPWMPKSDLTHILSLLKVFAQQLCTSTWRIHQLEANLEHPAVRKTKAFVEERFQDAEPLLSEAAANAGLSTSHLSHLFHMEMGIPFTRYVQARRVQEAKRLLADVDKSITEICFACGFNSLTHFNRVFKRSEGCSPSEYRLHPK